MSTKLPVYKMVISEDEASDLEVNYVALVDRPAIERDFMAFSAESRIRFKADEERRILSGPAMLANTPIYRKRGDEEFYAVFEPAEIEKIVQKFFLKNYHSNFNLMHDEKQAVDDVFVFESFIVDRERGIQPMEGFEDAPEGSWFISVKVNNDAVWKSIKKGKFKGFSVEGIFGLEKVKTEEQELLDELQQLVGDDHELFLEAKRILAS